mgnify:CR=1 FL=1
METRSLALNRDALVLDAAKTSDPARVNACRGSVRALLPLNIVAIRAQLCGLGKAFTHRDGRAVAFDEVLPGVAHLRGSSAAGEQKHRQEGECFHKSTSTMRPALYGYWLPQEM